jgi:hypothetical protein
LLVDGVEGEIDLTHAASPQKLVQAVGLELVGHEASESGKRRGKQHTAMCPQPPPLFSSRPTGRYAKFQERDVADRAARPVQRALPIGALWNETGRLLTGNLTASADVAKECGCQKPCTRHSDRLAQQTFDPHGILNPGKVVERPG